MPISNHSSTMVTIMFYTMDEMHTDALASVRHWRLTCVVCEDFVFFHEFHFEVSSILSQCVTICLVKFHCMLIISGDFHATFELWFVVALCNLGLVGFGEELACFLC